jgi:hypothetical protein
MRDGSLPASSSLRRCASFKDRGVSYVPRHLKKRSQIFSSCGHKNELLAAVCIGLVPPSVQSGLSLTGAAQVCGLHRGRSAFSLATSRLSRAIRMSRTALDPCSRSYYPHR